MAKRRKGQTEVIIRLRRGSARDALWGKHETVFIFVSVAFVLLSLCLCLSHFSITQRTIRS